MIRRYRILFILCMAALFFSLAANEECLDTHYNDEIIPKKTDSYQWQLSIAAIFRDEADYLEEWIEYYKMLGVEHFYLYNNLSDDHYNEVLEPYIKQGLVELVQWPYEHNNLNSWDAIQVKSYKNAIKKAEKNTKWLAILDTDEFIVPNQHQTLADLLKALEKDDTHNKIAQYWFKWIVFGTSNVYKIPEDKLMIEVLTLNGGPHFLYKAVFRPKYVGETVSPHWVSLIKEKETIEIPLTLGHINHYMYRDQNYLYNVKIPRREKIGTDSTTLLYWEAHCNNETEFSRKIQRFVPRLRQAMGYDE